jgi:hypothetical protein
LRNGWYLCHNLPHPSRYKRSNSASPTRLSCCHWPTSSLMIYLSYLQEPPSCDILYYSIDTMSCQPSLQLSFSTITVAEGEPCFLGKLVLSGVREPSLHDNVYPGSFVATKDSLGGMNVVGVVIVDKVNVLTVNVTIPYNAFGVSFLSKIRSTNPAIYITHRNSLVQGLSLLKSRPTLMKLPRYVCQK